MCELSQVAAADRRLQLSAKAQELGQDLQALKEKADSQHGKLLSQMNKVMVRAATKLDSRQLAQAETP